MSMLRWAVLAILLAAPHAQAVTLRICIDIHPHPPLLTPDGGGIAGRLARAAASAAGFAVELHTVPILRCRALLATGELHAFPMTPRTAELAAIARFPERNGMPDKSRASAVARLVAFRRVGSRVDWDGERFTGLDRPVLVPSTRVRLLDLVKAAGAPIDSSASSLELNFAKLLAGRGDAAVGFDGEGQVLMALSQFAGKIEMVPLALGEDAFYLAVDRAFYASHKDQVEAMWNQIARLKTMPEYQLPATPAKEKRQ